MRRRAMLGLGAAWPALLAPGAISAQLEAPHRPIRFERAAVDPFLPQSSVYLIHQDSRGLLWFATREGLGRWDGYEMRTWKATPFDPHALPGNVVRRLVEDSAGDLWVAAQPNDRLPLRVARLIGPDHEVVQTLPYDHAMPFLDRERAAWIVDADSIRRFDPEAGFVAMAPRLTRAIPRAVFMDRDGTIWIGDERGRIERHPLRGVAAVLEDPMPRGRNAEIEAIGAFFQDDRGRLWVLGSGVRRIEEGRLIVPSGLPAPLDTVGTSRMIQDPDGWLWLGSLDGVYRFDPSLSVVERHSLHLPGGIGTQNWVLALLRDRSGAIWAGTPWGLHRHDPSADAFGFLEHDPTNSNTIGSGLVMTLAESEAGALWVGTLGGGLNRVDRETGEVVRLREGPGRLRHDWVWNVAVADGNRVWAGTGAGLELVDLEAESPVTPIPLDPPVPPWTPSVMALRVEDGDVWIGYGGGVVRRSRAGALEWFPLPIPSEAEELIVDGGHLWAATSAGLVRIETRTAATRLFRHDPDDPRSLGHDVVLSLHIDRAGRLWAGTNSGLNRLEPDSGFTHFGDADGFASSAIYSILEDDDGRLWMGTNRGLVRFDPDAPAGSGVRVYDLASGIGNVEFNRNAALRGRDGIFYFGGDRGVTFFHPSSLRDNPYRPPVVITALHRSTRRGTRTDRYVGSAPVVLAPDDYTVTFELAALNYTNPGRNQYEYRLEGFDRQWIRAGTNRLVSYTNLPPGRYVLHARAANDDGLWNDEGLAQEIIVEPWFWETWWFRALALLLLVASVALATAYAQRDRHRRQLAALRYRQALEDERSRISRDMHDEVGASLTEIAILSELAVRRNGEPRATHRELEKISMRSRGMLDAIGEIVWALNPAHDRAEHLAAYLREYAAEFAESAGLDVALAFDASTATVPLTSEFRRNVFLILKEALANAAKHARASHVEVRLHMDAARLRLIVADDGAGFAGPPPGGVHDGLGNMTRRAQVIGGQLVIDSEPGRGTRVTFDVPLPTGSPTVPA